MDTTETNLIAHTINDALSGVPDEVQSFMWSPAYTLIIDSIQKVFTLSKEQRDTVQNGSYELLLGTKTMKDLSGEWVQSGMQPETIVKVLYAIHEEIITRAQSVTEFFTDDISDENPTVESTPVSSSNIVNHSILTSIGNRMSSPQAIAPTERDHSLDRAVYESKHPDIAGTSMPIPQAPNIPQAPKSDAYREAPEK